VTELSLVATMEDLSFLAKFPKLTDLSLNYNSPADIEKGIANIPNLRKITLYKNKNDKVDHKSLVPKMIAALSKFAILEFHAQSQYCWDQNCIEALANWISSPSCTLEILEISDWQKATSLLPIVKALASNSKLTHFTATAIPGLPPPSIFLELINSPTSCLTVLKINAKYGDKMACSADESAAIQAAVKSNPRIKKCDIHYNEYEEDEFDD